MLPAGSDGSFPPDTLPMSRLPLLCVAAGLAVLQLFAVALAQPAPQNDTDDAPLTSATYADLVRADQPAAYWRFADDQGTAELNGSPWLPQQIAGSVKFSQPGPRRQKFPLFDAGNQAAVFD